MVADVVDICKITEGKMRKEAVWDDLGQKCELKDAKSRYTSPNISTIRAIPLDQGMRFSWISTESNIVYKLMQSFCHDSPYL